MGLNFEYLHVPNITDDFKSCGVVWKMLSCIGDAFLMKEMHLNVFTVKTNDWFKGSEASL